MVSLSVLFRVVAYRYWQFRRTFAGLVIGYRVLVETLAAIRGKATGRSTD